MDAAGIQRKINRGGAIAARKLGQAFDLYRPNSATAPLDPARRIGSLLAYLDPDFQFQAKKPNLYGKPIWGGLFDRTLTHTGDYLHGATGTFFVAAIQSILPTAVVECNAIVILTRPAGNTAAGKQPYGGRRTTTDGLLLTGWPASMLRAGRTVAGRADLPGDVPDGGFEMLMPAVPGVTIRTSDRVTDNQGRAFVVSSVEYTDLGVRAVLVLAAT